jgi:hypothetical protein
MNIDEDFRSDFEALHLDSNNKLTDRQTTDYAFYQLTNWFTKKLIS